MKAIRISIDRNGRYAYENQPPITGWNLARFAETLLPLLHEDRNKAILSAQNEVSEFAKLYHNYWLEGMSYKLGLLDKKVGDEKLINQLLDLMAFYKADYTNTFRNLTLENLEAMPLFETETFKTWYHTWKERLQAQNHSPEAIKKCMQEHNPLVIPRNHRVEEALEAATRHHDYSVMHKLLDAITKPFDYTNLKEDYAFVPQQTGCKYQTFCGT